MTRVMLAVDGSELDEQVVATAQRLFGTEADYWALNVQGFEPAAGPMPVASFPAAYGAAYPIVAPDLYEVRSSGDGRTPAERAVQRAETVAEEAATHVDGGDVRAVGEVGDPADVIRRTADEHDVDVVVLGVHDRSWFSKLLDPSVADDLIEEHAVPLLLVSGRS